jgi:hypothetical protein
MSQNYLHLVVCFIFLNRNRLVFAWIKLITLMAKHESHKPKQIHGQTFFLEHAGELHIIILRGNRFTVKMLCMMSF